MNPYESPQAESEPLADTAATSRPGIRWRLLPALLSCHLGAAFLTTLGYYLRFTWTADLHSTMWAWRMLEVNLVIAVTQFCAAGCWWRRYWMAAVLLNLTGFALLRLSEMLLVR